MKFVFPYKLLGVFLILSICSCHKNDFNEGVQTSSTAYLFAATHNGEVKRYDINSGQKTTYQTASTDAEGIYYDGRFGLSLVSRSSKTLETYAIDNSNAELLPDLSGVADLESPRDIAVSDDFYVVSDNADVGSNILSPNNRFFIYQKTASGLTLRNVIETGIKVWGIEFVDKDLYAAVDESGKIAVFRNFIGSNVTNAIVNPTKTIAIQGLIRAHGLDYENGTMVLTDIGDPESNSDGALHIITNFDAKFNARANDETIPSTEQLSISGNNTKLGNPVNVVYDSNYNTIFVAEATNGGGQVLAFNSASSVTGNISPDLKYGLSGISSVYFYTE